MSFILYVCQDLFQDSNKLIHFPSFSDANPKGPGAPMIQSHGHSPYSDRKLNYHTLANDVNTVMEQLKMDSAAVIGYRFGGTVACIEGATVQTKPYFFGT